VQTQHQPPKDSKMKINPFEQIPYKASFNLNIYESALALDFYALYLWGGLVDIPISYVLLKLKMND